MYSLDNDCRFEGNLTKDPIIQNVGEKARVVKFSIAVNEYLGKDKDPEVNFIDLEAWDTAADVIAEHAQKGSRIKVQATLRNDRWKDKEGNPRSRILFRVNKFKLMDRKKAAAPVAANSSDEPF